MNIMTFNNNIIKTLIDDYADSLCGMLNRIYDDIDDAMDTCQDAFIKVIDKFNVIDKNKIKPYLFQVAFNLALNKKRDKKNRDLLIKENISDVVYNPDQNEINQTILLKTELEKLSEKQNEAIVLKFYGGLKAKEIAKIMDISEGSVKTHLSRGLQNLKNNILNRKGAL
ncbi:MAG: hypothetical protein DRP35_01975 [Candidatus Zixiibacteriota bacterium]|nr:MAG: hypothetical protein DRP35_01975 [candidate division Zixibacteria bacterium]